MKISILTLFPEMMKSFFTESIIKRAVEKGLVEIEIINIREFAIDSYGTVDDRPYGGGAGMVLRVDIVDKALQSISNSENKKNIVLTSPRGRVLNQALVESYVKSDKHLIILCGHYEGFDERVSELVNEEVSLGDFVMTGGEITAAAMTDAVVRLLSGVIKKDSAQDESFSEISVDVLYEAVGEDEIIKKLVDQGIKTVRLLEYRHYTRPEEYQGKKVPDILLSGHHKEIQKWRLKQAFEETKKRKPDLLLAK